MLRLQSKYVRELREGYAAGELDFTDIQVNCCLSSAETVKLLQGDSYPLAGGPILLSSIPSQLIALTEENEAVVREFLFDWWEERWKDMRLKSKLELRADITDERRAELERLRWCKQKAPVDLSGACKVSSQFSRVVFPLPHTGRVFTNTRHAFIRQVTSDGVSIYDLNRNCQDVASMRVKGKDPYEPNFERNSSKEGLRGLHSWHTRLVRLAAQFQVLIKSEQLELHQGPLLDSIPDWCVELR